jgi:O-antigen/teichoic acid export membrane protein
MSRSERFNSLARTESVRENLKTKSVHGAFFTAAGSGIDFLLRLASTAVLARMVIPEHWGLVGMVTAITAIAEQFRDLGLSAATLQSKEISHKQVTNLFWVNVVAGALFTLVMSAAAPAVSAFYGDPRLTLITVAISTNFFWAGLLVQHQALLMRQMKLPQIAIINITANALSGVLAVVLAMNHYGYWALAWREMARIIFTAAGTWALCPWMPSLPGRGAEIGNLLRFGRDITLTHILDAIVSNVDKLLIGKFSGPVPLGMYRQGYWLIMAPVTYLCAPVQRVAQPALSALQADPGRYRRYYERVVFLVSLPTLPFCGHLREGGYRAGPWRKVDRCCAAPEDLRDRVLYLACSGHQRVGIGDLWQVQDILVYQRDARCDADGAHACWCPLGSSRYCGRICRKIDHSEPAHAVF